MSTIAEIVEFLETSTPTTTAEDWDNVGLLVGDRARPATCIMTCLTVTSASASEAIREGADLIVTHHPLPFQPIKRLTTDHSAGRLLWQLIGGQISIYSPHTAYDSAVDGINAQLARRIGIDALQPLIPEADGPGAGRFGNLASPSLLTDFAQQVKRAVRAANVQFVGEPNRPIRRIGIACGSGGDFLEPAVTAGCDCLLTGEARFHTCLEAEAADIALVLAGHYATERFALEVLADRLALQFPNIRVWASRDERDPLAWL